MKKALAVLVLSLALMGAAPSQAAVTTYPSPVVYSLANVGPSFWPFFSAVTFGAFVVYADATGLDTPLCGHNWLNDKTVTGPLGSKCYPEYPENVRNGGDDPEHD